MTRPPVAVIAALTLAAAGVWLLSSQPSADPVPASAGATASPHATGAAVSPDSSTSTRRGQNPPTPQGDPSPPTDPETVHDQGEHATGEIPPSGEPWRATLSTFAAAFTDTTGGQQAWHRRLAPVISPPLADQLPYTDLTRIPAGAPSSVTIVAAGAYGVQALVEYDTGWTLSAHVVVSGVDDQWWVADYGVADKLRRDRASALQAR